jgi:exopolyphosphatase/guanosine-5'-triphosphate,3'-diphosphate pyrophosphatase
MRVAAIDIGSNSIRLLVGEVTDEQDGGGLKTIARAGEACRLARGLDGGGRIAPDVGERAAKITAEFAGRARALGARHVVIGATAALRAAENGAAVAESIGARVGLPVRILSGEDEARLVYGAVVEGFGAAAQRSSCVVFDIGGGSTEVISGVGERAGRWASLGFGAVTLTERFFRSEAPAREEVERLSEWVRGQLMHECALMPPAAPVLAGVGGTVTVLALLDRGLEQYDPQFIEGWVIGPEQLEALVERIVTSSAQSRREWPAVGESRSDIAAAGALVVRELYRRFPSPGLVCSTQGLRYGLARVAAREARDGSTDGGSSGR